MLLWQLTEISLSTKINTIITKTKMKKKKKTENIK